PGIPGAPTTGGAYARSARRTGARATSRPLCAVQPRPEQRARARPFRVGPPMSVRTGELRKSTGWESERPAITPGPIDRANARGNRLRVAFFVETPHRLTGAPRSLLAALSRIEDYGIDTSVDFRASGTIEEAFSAAGGRTRDAQAPPTLCLISK